jgi:hypothetical protein
MSRARPPKCADATSIASLIITVEGCKVIKDVDLAALLGVSLPALYKRIGGKLWMLRKNMYFKLSPRYARGRLDTQPPLAFTQLGVIVVVSIFGDDDSLEVGMAVVHALRNRRRSPTLKKRPGRQVDPERAARYYEAMSRMLRGRLHEMLKKMRH